MGQPCKEAFSGEHGEFLLRTIEALIDYYDQGSIRR